MCVERTMVSNIVFLLRLFHYGSGVGPAPGPWIIASRVLLRFHAAVSAAVRETLLFTLLTMP